ncbi:MAG: phosphatase PAP2 family protein [Cytophagaceae bacterium]|nr:MAG: phosphatase PAP2 family protein [Cytophagaceae bacterium]
MSQPIAPGLAVPPWQRHPFLAFTALTVLACAGLLLAGDVPLAQWLHTHAAGAAPFFAAFTAAVDAAYAATNLGGRPTLLAALALAYVVGRWGLRQRWATVFLLTLLTHGCSTVSASMLQVAVHRPRPDVLFTPGSTASLSFPSSHTAIYWSLFWPLAGALPRWRAPLLVVPVLIALGRLVLGAHYLSDVWAAIWLVVAWAALWAGVRRLVGLGLRKWRS